jgi:hypothetical protein
VGEEHARVAPALGAFAVGALDPEEAAAVLAAVRGAGRPGPAGEALAAATAELLRHLEAPAGPGAGGEAGQGLRDLDPRRRRAGRARAPAQPARPAHLHAVVALGVRLLPPAIDALGAGRPGGAVALALGGPGGGAWTVPAPGEGPVAATGPPHH